jgi:hypothetical protein
VTPRENKKSEVFVINMNNPSVSKSHDYLNIIFDLRSQLIDKEFKITMLELELNVAKELQSILKKCLQSARPTTN